MGRKDCGGGKTHFDHRNIKLINNTETQLKSRV